MGGGERRIEDTLRARALVVTLVSVTCTKGCSFAGALIAARILGADAFGKYSLFATTIMMLEVIAAIGMPVAAARHSAWLRHTPGRCSLAVAVCIWSSTIASAVLLPPVVLMLTLGGLSIPLDVPKAALWLLVVAAPVGLVTLLQGVAVGVRSTPMIVATQVPLAAALLALPPMGAVAGGHLGAMWGLAGAYVAGLIASIWSLRCALGTRLRRLSTKVLVRSGLAREIRRIAVPAFLGALMVPPVIWLGNLSLVGPEGSTVELGLYQVAYQWYSLLLVVPNILSQEMLPRFVDSHRVASYAAASQLRLVSLITMLLLCALGVALFATMRFWLPLYGPSFARADVLLPGAVCAAVVAAFSVMVAAHLAAVDRMWLYMQLHAVWAISFLGAALASRGLGLGAAGLLAALVLANSLRLAGTAYAYKARLSEVGFGRG